MTAREQSERYARLRLILGDEGLNRLQRARVMVIGLGGVGSSCAEALVRGGVGALDLVDGDVVEESNINRQALAFTSTIGMTKTEAMRRMVAEIQPDCHVALSQTFLNAANTAQVLGAMPRPDYVIDCVDTVTAKIEIIRWCASEKLSLLSAMGAANKLDPSFLKFSDIKATQNCPLSRVMRRECRVRGLGKVQVLYSDETPVQVQGAGGTAKAHTLGSMSYMPPVMGQMMAGKVIRQLVGLEKGASIPTLAVSSEKEAWS